MRGLSFVGLFGVILFIVGVLGMILGYVAGINECRWVDGIPCPNVKRSSVADFIFMGSFLCTAVGAAAIFLFRGEKVRRTTGR
jgi:hypothetical protein